MTATRTYPSLARLDRTIHFIGDPHMAQYAPYVAQGTTRRARWTTDIASPTVGAPCLRVVIGDLIENYASGDGVQRDQYAKDAMNALLPAVPWDVVVGNHDLAGATDQYRTADVWAALYGYPDQNWTKVLTDAQGSQFVKLVAAGTDTMNSTTDPPIILSQATLDWLSTELGNTSLPCLVLCHAPLKNTVLGSGYNSSQTFFHVHALDMLTDDAAIRAILNAHPTAKAWISGHSHNRITDQDFAKVESVGTRSIMALNLSSPWYVTALPPSPLDPICTIFVTVTATGLEIRFRNHGAGVWDSIGSQRVVTYTF